MVNAALSESLKKLRLSGMSQTLGVRLEEAVANRLDHAEEAEIAALARSEAATLARG